MAGALAVSQIDELAERFAAAFQNYPLARWLFDEDIFAQPALISLFRLLFALPAANKFDIRMGTDGNAVAVWLASEQMPLFSAREGSRALQLFRHELGPKVTRRLRQFQLASDRHHSEGAFDYLFLLAVRPEMQGRGFGGTLLNSHLRRSKALNRRVVLETAEESNLQFYRTFGFKVTDQYRVAPDCPLIWIMEN